MSQPVNRAQHLSDALMFTMEDVYQQIAHLQATVAALQSRRHAQIWMNRVEAAEYLRISTTKLDELRGEGRLVSHRIDGRPVFHIDDLDAVAVRDEPLRLVS